MGARVGLPQPTGGSHEPIKRYENTRYGSSCACHCYDARTASGCGVGCARSGDRRYSKHQPAMNFASLSQFRVCLTGPNLSTIQDA
jgi:hypothetical protein